VIPLLDRLAWVVPPLGALAVAGSFFREGLWLNKVHVGLLVAVSALLLLRRRLPLRAVLWGIGVTLVVNACTNLIALGLASLGLMILGCTAVYIATTFGLRAGLWAVGLFTVATAVLGAAVCTGTIPIPAVAGSYLTSAPAWVAQVAAFPLYTLVIVLFVGAVQAGLARRAAELGEQIEVRERVESELRQREEHYRLLAENMSDMVLVQDLELKLTYVSPNVEEILGYTVEEAMELGPRDYLAAASLQRMLRDHSALIEAHREGGAPPLAEYEYRRKDGSTFWGELRTTILTDRGGGVVGTQGVLRDVSERREMERTTRELEEQLRQSEKLRAIGELAGGVAHDFNNQLTGIIGGAELLRLDLDDREELAGVVDQIMTAATRAADLTSKLTAFARRGQFRSEPTDINGIINEVVELLERSIDRTIVLTRKLARDTVVVVGDPTQLQNALLNVALNARDALREGGELQSGGAGGGTGQVVFSSELVPLEHPRAFATGMELAPGRYVRIAVSDNGVGMSPETQRRIFEPFFTTKQPGRGTGMGLAAAYGTVNVHRGAIEVESVPGEGTTFRIYLPAVDRPAQEPRVEQTALPGGSGLVLVVDDEPAVRETASQLLEYMGYEVITASTGDEAVRRFGEHAERIDLVVLDMILPRKSGQQVFAAIRDLKPSARVLLCSGHSLEHEVQKLLEQPGAAFLQKPFTAAALAEAVRQLLTGPIRD
jgi:PAS domain S-box-containing protein